MLRNIDAINGGILSGHWNNLYTQHLASDNALCVPVLQQEQLAAILLRTQQIAELMEGAGPKPRVSLDLEHLQVADYAAFPPITQQQQKAIRRLQAAQPIRTDEMAYLALRSLIGLFWGEPQREDDIRRAAAYEKALETVLTEVSPLVAQALAKHDAPLPYWGRLRARMNPGLLFRVEGVSAPPSFYRTDKLPTWQLCWSGVEVCISEATSEDRNPGSRRSVHASGVDVDHVPAVLAPAL